MSKGEFLESLKRLLKSLGKSEREKSLSYYSEMIDDYMEDGYTEEDAVEQVGNPGLIAQEILEEQGDKAGSRMSRGMKGLIGVLLILGFPLWGSLALAGICLLLAAVLLVLSAYIVIWCIPVCTGAFSAAGLVLSVVSMGGAAVIVFQNPAAGVLQLGVGMALAGIFVLFGLLTWILAKIFTGVTIRFSRWLAGVVIRKRGAEA
ncbi:DUF1700 domain-containing protein [Anaerostipes sp.]|uniref:DUF1700 domain-containing protein n=1 Tax=Anaerostipes sp. TaxID=1872530 RepID=UPI0025C2ECD6|nr:DUF1700 domain-containing protein [Anaerostipes sp.]MBS7007477.1 DUF1700 domain-containing protein [Anaerostipes sp.]